MSGFFKMACRKHEEMKKKRDGQNRDKITIQRNKA